MKKAAWKVFLLVDELAVGKVVKLAVVKVSSLGAAMEILWADLTVSQMVDEKV